MSRVDIFHTVKYSIQFRLYKQKLHADLFRFLYDGPQVDAMGSDQLTRLY